MTMRILRPKEVISKLGISKSTFYDWQNEKSKNRYKPDFPKPINLGVNSVGYLESEIDEFITKMLEQRNIQ
ncbi:AlpA family phage regulatory protein [Bisgaard Taxon 10/6]|uniref:AlpA family phage regulatory protein n=3 Tax=Pasteurellaceae TaxID=712 RepID=A0ABT6ER54_9PAST|nr:AlpA family phage regulatory protein [Exercitatus varius]MDG2938927.1 AlpA family phage regulatory protein [Exercitatus varius]MDG2945875.1 AlpA family phage regulatory protein [Exercitatus varius]